MFNIPNWKHMLDLSMLKPKWILLVMPEMFLLIVDSTRP
jgi:hypothetical protein